MDRRSYGDAITVQVRAISLGVLAVVWVLMNRTESSLNESFGNYSHSLVSIAAFAVLALVLDMAQLALSYRISHSAYIASQYATKLSEVTYPTSSGWLSTAYCLFWAKQIVVSLSAICLLLTIGKVLLIGP